MIENEEFVEMFGPPEAKQVPKPVKKKAVPKKKKKKSGNSDSSSSEDTEAEREREKEKLEAKKQAAEYERARRQSIFGHEDELKVAPKGFAKDQLGFIPLLDFVKGMKRKAFKSRVHV